MELRKGIVTEKRDIRNYTVQELLEDRLFIKVVISGKMRMAFIEINIGDKIYFELSPVDRNKARYVSDEQAAKYWSAAKKELDIKDRL